MIEGLAKQEIIKKLGPLVTPERVVLFFLILILYSEKSIFNDIIFLNTEISIVISNAIDSIKTTKTWVFLFLVTIIFIGSPVLTHQTIKNISEMSIRHSAPLYEKIEAEAKVLSEDSHIVNDLKVEAAENALTLRKNSQFFARSTSLMFSSGICLLIYTTGYELIIPITIIGTAFVLCYQASIELIKFNYENVQKYLLAATLKEQKRN